MGQTTELLKRLFLEEWKALLLANLLFTADYPLERRRSWTVGWSGTDNALALYIPVAVFGGNDGRISGPSAGGQ